MKNRKYAIQNLYIGLMINKHIKHLILSCPNTLFQKNLSFIKTFETETRIGCLHFDQRCLACCLNLTTFFRQNDLSSNAFKTSKIETVRIMGVDNNDGTFRLQ